MNKSALIKTAAMVGLVAVALVSSAITGFGAADTTDTGTLTASPMSTAAPVETIAPTPSPLATDLPAATPVVVTKTIQEQVDNHEARITALEQVAPVTAKVEVTPSPTPVTTPVFVPTCSAPGHTVICTGN